MPWPGQLPASGTQPSAKSRMGCNGVPVRYTQAPLESNKGQNEQVPKGFSDNTGLMRAMDR